MDTRPIVTRTGSRYTLAGTFTNPTGTVEQTIATVSASAFGSFGRVCVELDCSALTKNGNVSRIYLSSDGVAYVAVSGRSVTFSAAQWVAFDFTTAKSFRVTLQSGANEGVTRLVPYEINIY